MKKAITRIASAVIIILIIIVAALLAVFASGALSGTSTATVTVTSTSTSVSTSVSTTAKQYNVAYLSWDLSIGGGFFENLTNTLSATLGTYGITLHAFYSSDAATQASQADALLAATPKYDAVIISALDYNAIIPKNVNFNNNRIPVFYLCCGPNETALSNAGGSYINLVEQGNVKSVADEAQFVVNYLAAHNTAKPYTIVLLNGAQSTTPAIQRAQGYHQVLDPLVASGVVKIISEQYGDWTSPTAKTEMDNILAANPNTPIDAVLTTQDAMAVGAAASLQAAGKLNSPTVVVGHDCTPSGLQAVRSGQVLACYINTGSQQAYWTGQVVANYLLNGLTPTTHDMDVFAGVAMTANATSAENLPGLPAGTYASGANVLPHTYSAATSAGGSTPQSITYMAIFVGLDNFLSVIPANIQRFV